MATPNICRNLYENQAPRHLGKGVGGFQQELNYPAVKYKGDYGGNSNRRYADGEPLSQLVHVVPNGHRPGHGLVHALAVPGGLIPVIILNHAGKLTRGVSQLPDNLAQPLGHTHKLAGPQDQEGHHENDDYFQAANAKEVHGLVSDESRWARHSSGIRRGWVSKPSPFKRLARVQSGNPTTLE